MKVRIALPCGSFVPEVELKEAARLQRDRLDEKVLLPQELATGHTKAAGVGAGQLSVACEDGCVFTFPERECLLLPVPRITMDAIAATIWEWIVALGSPAAESLQGSGAIWMEVSLADGSGGETTVRKNLRSRPAKSVNQRGVGAGMSSVLDW